MRELAYQISKMVRKVLKWLMTEDYFFENNTEENNFDLRQIHTSFWF